MLLRFLLAVCLSCVVSKTHASDAVMLPNDVQEILKQNCNHCHGTNDPEGDVRLDTILDSDLNAQLDLLNRAQEQLFLKRMPPEEEEQPTASENERLRTWVSTELAKHNASSLEKKLQKPEYGNYVDHEKLFSGEYLDSPGFTWDRRWLISEYIFNAKFQRILQGNTHARRQGKNVPVYGSHRFRSLSLTNPFLLPTRSGVRYYADTDLSGGHLSSMLTNAQKASEYITDYLVKRNPKYLPAVREIMALEEEQNVKLAARRELMNDFIAKICDEVYGEEENLALLPQFAAVKLKEVKSLEEGETYKKAPTHVAMNMLKNLKGENTVFRTLIDPEYQDFDDQAFREHCERSWFYFGDHERDIQGRMTILRDYMPEIREQLEKNRRKYKLLEFKPLAPEEMAAIEAGIRQHRKLGDRYAQIIEKCIAKWEKDFAKKRLVAGPPSEELIAKLVDQLSLLILERSPNVDEADEYLAVAKGYITKLGNLKAIQKLIQTLMLSSEFVYRQEFGSGAPDQYGRRMLSPRDAAYAIAYALTDQSPDAELVLAAENGKLNTREDYLREVKRILAKRDVFYLIDPILEDKSYPDNTTDTAIRKLRFVREFFGYPKAITIFKDEKRFGGDRIGNATARLLNETDRLVEHILERDVNVFEELLTTEEFYVYHDGDNERMQAASDRIKSIYAHFKDLDWQNFKKEDLLDHREFLKEVKMRSVDPDKLDARNRQGNTIQLFKKSMRTITARLNKGQQEAAPYDLYRGYGNDFMRGYNVAKFFNFSLDNWDYETLQPAKVVHRKGLLTHPAWLMAHAQNTETDPVIRGKWVREKLLAGTIPDVPITVDAKIPEDHHRTLRERLASATESDYCWKCHQQMNPLGYAFEIYDDFGRFRLEEPLEHPDNLIQVGPEQRGDHLVDTRDTFETRPVNSKGFLEGTGSPLLDGEVRDAMELAERLGKSKRVRQSIIRHAFRYFMGRNETLSDSRTLIDAEQAYLESEGSLDAVIVSLLTSDSFIYRKAVED
ncbi:MAG: DUF1588 domain-containing protein [Planctomycetota bacterium]|nr:DUF1588 domain-containing protein [Planctomycetota bacterium]